MGQGIGLPDHAAHGEPHEVRLLDAEPVEQPLEMCCAEVLRPADAEIASHKLLLRAGLVRKLGGGLYTYMPAGLRVVQKISQLCREEMDREGAIELSMPFIHPVENWVDGPRWSAAREIMYRVDHAGAVIGELSARRSMGEAGIAGLGATLGLVLGGLVAGPLSVWLAGRGTTPRGAADGDAPHDREDYILSGDVRENGSIIGSNAARMREPDGSLEPSSCWGVPTLWSMALFALGITTLASKNRWLDPESLGSWQRDSVREVGVITGCFLLTPLDIWKQLRGLDERYFMYGEDVDFAMRAKAAGRRPVICPEATLVHEVGQSSDTPVHKMLLLYRGKASLVRTHWKGPARKLGIFLLAAGTALRASAANVIALVRKTDTAGRWQTLWQKRDEWLPGY